MKRKVYQSLFFLFIIVFVFQQKLSQIIPVFNYLDETCALILFILGIIRKIISIDYLFFLIITLGYIKYFRNFICLISDIFIYNTGPNMLADIPHMQ